MKRKLFTLALVGTMFVSSITVGARSGSYTTSRGRNSSTTTGTWSIEKIRSGDTAKAEIKLTSKQKSSLAIKNISICGMNGTVLERANYSSDGLTNWLCYSSWDYKAYQLVGVGCTFYNCSQEYGSWSVVEGVRF